MPQNGKPGLSAYNEAFLQALQQLNEQQRQAVDQIEGPVLVIAGPGTGKTHILSSRVGRILLETDAQAHNILCLTFTEAGVSAMRQRLLEFIGPEAHRLPIYTFHSFCNAIIQDNLELFGRQDLEPVSDLERVELIRSVLDGLPPEHPLRRGQNDAYFYESHLQALFQQMKAERWTAARVHQAIDAYLQSLPQREEFMYKVKRGAFNKGDLKQSKIDAERDKMERLRAAVDLFPAYQGAMQQAGRYDYDDMILWVLQAFEQHEFLLRTYQERYLYLLIDEYQDTNGAQNAIIRQLVAYWDLPNLFIVGDDDQSIYEFQGARLKNLADFYRDYQHGLSLVLLQQNYRSTQPILDASLELIQHNQIRIVNSLQDIEIEKILLAQERLASGAHPPPLIRSFPQPLQEEVWLVEELQRLREAGFPLEETAVIYAKHRQVEGVMELLEKRGIPYQTRRRVNILRLPLLQNLRQMLEYFAAEFRRPYSGEHLLFQILHFPYFGIAPDDIARLSMHLAKLPAENRPGWRDVLREEAHWEQLGLDSRAELRAFARFQHHLLSHYASLSAPAFVERLLNRSGLLAYVLKEEEKAWRLQVLRSFLDFVRQEAARRPRLTVGGLLDLLRSMDANRLPIEVNESVYAREGVHLLTAHSAKGLEFRQVFLLDCTRKPWEPRSRGSSFRFSLPDTLTLSGEEDPLEARRRLFYVAMTRAKERLSISYATTDRKGKTTNRAVFVEELVQRAELKVQEESVAEERLLEAEALRLAERQPPQLPQQEHERVEAMLEGFQLSVSALNRYLKCPLGFYYENVLRAPVLMREAAHYGTAMHNALERYFERMKTDKEQRFPPLATLLELFEREMERRRGFFARAEFDRRLEAGRYNLEQYRSYHLNRWNKQVLLEYRPRNVEVEGVPVTGSIDKLEQIGADGARVVDYKTGSQSAQKLQRPSEVRPMGGSYWRQLVFYKLLYENHPANTRVVKSAAISYLEPSRSGAMLEREVTFEPEDALMVRQLVKDTYARIKAHDFYTGCGETDCPWCNFVRNSVLPNTFAQPDIEALDDR
jgi:DNA helicase II / ATP-dependent DNA helicase PcrA